MFYLVFGGERGNLLASCCDRSGEGCWGSCVLWVVKIGLMRDC